MSAGKRGPVGPLVNTSDEDSDPDSPRGPRPEEPLTIKIPSPGPISPTEHDHDYDNVSSPSSTASGPTYVRQPGFTHHAHKFVVKPNKVKKKKLIPPGTVNLDDRKLLEKPEPVPPTKPKPRRETLSSTTTGRHYDIQKSSRALASRTNRFELGHQRSGRIPMACLAECNKSPACRAVNAFTNGSCEVLMSPVTGVNFSVESTAYIPYFETCPVGFGNTFVTRGHALCYKFVLDGWLSEDDARDHCYSLGGDLVAVETAEEMAHLSNIGRYDQCLQGPGFWTSGTDVEKEGRWVWASTGSQVDSNLPSREVKGDGQKDCLFMKWEPNSVWNKYYCDRSFFPLCEVGLA